MQAFQGASGSSGQGGRAKLLLPYPSTISKNIKIPKNRVMISNNREIRLVEIQTMVMHEALDGNRIAINLRCLTYSSLMNVRLNILDSFFGTAERVASNPMFGNIYPAANPGIIEARDIIQKSCQTSSPSRPAHYSRVKAHI